MYSAKEVAQIVGLQESRVRDWAQTGVVGPSESKGGRAVYSFRDLVGVKTAKELLDRGVTLQQVRRNLEALKAQLPHVDRPLAQLRIVSDGDRLVVVDEGARFEPLSGQLVMDFGIQQLSGLADEIAKPPVAVEPPKKPARTESAYSWFLEGARLEDEPGQEDQALIAYEKALSADPKLAAAHTNLGNLLFRRGVAADARKHYETALSLDPDQPEARYNLANLLDELGERHLAVAQWYRVVSECPEFADAHFNLGLAYLQDGVPTRARVHFEHYLAIDQAGEWAEKAREILRGM